MSNIENNYILIICHGGCVCMGKGWGGADRIMPATSSYHPKEQKSPELMWEGKRISFGLDLDLDSRSDWSLGG